MQAEARASERDARRERRAQEKQRRVLEQADPQAYAALEVEFHSRRVAQLGSVHRTGTGLVDWRKIADAPAPPQPPLDRCNERAAMQALETYRPTLWTRVLGRDSLERAKLRKQIAAAKRKDNALHRDLCANHEKTLAGWREERALAQRLLNSDALAYMEVLQQLQPFSRIADLGSRIRLKVLDAKTVSADIEVHEQGAIPHETKRLVDGELLVEPTPKVEFHRLHHTYVCSCTLRVARELFALLPIQTALVSALGAETGEQQRNAILSVVVRLAIWEKLDLERVDASEAVERFVHRVAFDPATGFSPVDKITVGELEAADAASASKARPLVLRFLTQK